MPAKTIIFMLAFLFACGGALYTPLIGAIGYVLHYHFAPEQQWWGIPLADLGIRFSMVLAIMTAIGILIHFRKQKLGGPILSKLEILLLLLLLIVWASKIFGLPQPPRDLAVDLEEVKLTKVIIFTLMLTHIITTVRRFNILMWAFVIGAMFLGYQAFTAPGGMFSTGRLNFIGGPDFTEANGLAAHLIACLPLIGVMFLRSSWKGKLICLVAGVLTVNGIILTRSRGGAVAMAGAAVVAIVFAPKNFRRKAIVCVLIVLIGTYALTDPSFWQRAQSITAESAQRDVSAQSRFDIWAASVKLFKTHPLGVGVGNFPTYIHPYIPQYPPKDAHNTYVLCYSELGIQGITVYMAIIVSAMWLLFRTPKNARTLSPQMHEHITWLSYAAMVGLSAFLFSSLTMSRLYSEGPYWFMFMPVCLARAVANAQEEISIVPAVEKPKRRRNPFAPRPKPAV